MQSKEPIGLEESSGKGYSESSSATLLLGLLVHFES